MKICVLLTVFMLKIVYMLIGHMSEYERKKGERDGERLFLSFAQFYIGVITFKSALYIKVINPCAYNEKKFPTRKS